MRMEDMPWVTKWNKSKKEDLITQLEASKSSIKDLYNDLLNDEKGFKYQIAHKSCVKKIQAKRRNWIYCSLLNSDKSSI